jgi:hypothetical protein
MARTIKIDNSLRKKFASKGSKQKSKDIVVHFLIVCEGAKTEPNYFSSFTPAVGKFVYDIQFEGGGISTKKVVEKAIELRDNSPQKYDRVWAVFDRDSFPARDFNAAILKAKSNGISCAWSNEAFELWYLLHFHNRVTAMKREKYKKAIEDAVNAKSANNRKKFNYVKNATDMYDVLQKYGNQEQAILWAKDLAQQYDDEKFANHNPVTQVYKLVEELIGKSEELNKEITIKFKEGK